MTAPLWDDEILTYERPDGVTVIRRDVFTRDHFDYNLGEHVVFGGPSTRGKTTLAFDLLQHVATADSPAFIAVSKPSDPVTAERGNALGYRRVAEWPPPVKIGELMGGEKPRGYLIWPPFGDIDNDMERAGNLTRKLISDRYTAGANPRKNKGGILVMDDTMVKAKIMGLDSQMVTILAMAGAMKLGLWIFVQKPTDSGRTTLWGYENATHIFLTKGGDSQMLKRYSEIAGDRGAIVKAVVPTLEPYQFLYLHKVEGYVCIVDAK